MTTGKKRPAPGKANLAKLVAGFNSPEFSVERVRYKDKMQGVQLWDIWIKIISRIVVAFFFGCLLWKQNTLVFKLVQESMNQDRLKDLQIVFSALIAGTLAETYFITRIIVEWIFRDINYESD